MTVNFSSHRSGAKGQVVELFNRYRLISIENWPDFICRLNPSYSGFRRLAMKTNEGKKSTRHQSKTRFFFIFLSCESNAFDQGRPLRRGGCARAPATPFRAAFYFRGARKKDPLANRFRAIRMAAARLLACVPRTTRALSSHPPPEEFCFCEVEIPFFTEKIELIWR